MMRREGEEKRWKEERGAGEGKKRELQRENTISTHANTYFPPSLPPDICEVERSRYIITIDAPMIYTAPCIMLWIRAYPLRGQVGGGWALEFESFWAL